MPEQTQQNPPVPKPKTWWKRKEVLGGIGLVLLNAAASPLVGTINPWVSFGANIALGILTAAGVIQGAMAKNMALTKENYKIGTK